MASIHPRKLASGDVSWRVPLRYCDCDEHSPESYDAAMHRLRMDADAFDEPHRTRAHAEIDRGLALFRDLQGTALAELIRETF